MPQKKGYEAENVVNLAFSECEDLSLKWRTKENKNSMLNYDFGETCLKCWQHQFYSPTDIKIQLAPPSWIPSTCEKETTMLTLANFKNLDQFYP